MIPPYMPSRYSEALSYYAARYPAGANIIPLRVGGTARALDPPNGATHIAVASSGSGYAAGQIIQLQGGATILITSVNLGGVTAGTIISAGSGYTAGQVINQIGGNTTGTGFQGQVVTVGTNPYVYHPSPGKVAAT